MRIDAHHHVWDLADRPQPWTTDIPQLNKSFTIDELRPELQLHRIDGIPRMLTRRLGRTKVSVTALGFGAAPIGNLYSPLTDEDAYAAIETAWNGGVRYFDTAPHYGLGLSEERLGAALAGRARAQFAVSTKVGRLLHRNPVPTGSDLAAGGFAVPDTLIRTPDYTRDGVLRSLEASLERLRLDRVDVVYVHDPDDHMDQAIHEALPALADLRDQGVVGAIGAGMNTVAPLTRIVAEADVDVLMVAGRWTLLDRTAEPLLDACVARDMSVVAAAPFNSGLLAHRWPPDDAHFDYGPAPTPVLEHARDLARACTLHGTTLPHAAIQFPLRHPAVASVVTGVRTRAQAQFALDWSAADIPEHLWTEVELRCRRQWLTGRHLDFGTATGVTSISGNRCSIP